MQTSVNVLSKEVVAKLIPTEFHQFITVEVLSLPPNPDDFIDPFRKSLALIAPKFTDPKPIAITIGTSPFETKTNSASTILEFINGTEQLTSGNRIYLDWNHLNTGSFEFRTAVILEELSHCMFNIGDEDLVRAVVCHIYPEVFWNGREYEKKP